jgi:glycosyltransferase involved in cell wall biosynthesis
MNCHDLPEASIVIPINRDDGFFDTCINSLRNQSYTNFEIIIVANNCDDSLWERIQNINDQRIVSVRTQLGQIPYNLNLGICLARSDLIIRMDSDDISEPTRVESFVSFFDLNSSVSVAGSFYSVIDSEDNIVIPEVHVLTENSQIYDRLFFESTMAQPTIAFRKTAFLAVGGYDFGSYAEDWDLWIRLKAKNYLFSNIPKVLLRYRVHSSQETSARMWRRNLAFVLSLYARHFLISMNFRYILGALRHIFVQVGVLIKRKLL